jgi:predicted  nucleic acid-binding Zn-ribbon protein
MEGDPMAALDTVAGICLGCNLPVTKQDMNRILADNDIIFCKSCNRILYIPEGSPSEAKGE